MAFLTVVVVYATWAVFQNAHYYVGAAQHRDLISPLYSPCLTGSCVPGAGGSFALNWWHISPGLLALIVPGGFRATCYYYRKAYYRGSGSRRRLAPWPTATPATPARPASR